MLIPHHRHFIDGPTIYWDLETTGKHAWLGSRPFAFSFTNDAADEWCFEFDVDPFTRQPIVRPEILEMMKRLLEDDAIRKVGFNVKFDVRMMDIAYGIKTRGRIDDVMWKSHVCNSAEMKHALKPLSDKYTGGQLDKDDEKELGDAVKACRVRAKKLGWKIAKEESGEEKDSGAYKADYWLPKAIWKLAPESVKAPLLEKWPHLRDLNRKYAQKDAVRTAVLDLFYSGVMDREELWEVYEREIRLAPITYRTEQVGVRIFEDRCIELGKECQAKLRDLRGELSRIFGDFNVEVPDTRVRKYLFGPKEEGSLGLPVTARTAKTKEPAVTKEVLNGLVVLLGPESPGGSAVESLQSYAKHQKVWSHYVQKYMAHARADALGQLIIHANIRQIGPTTGRMSIADPPLHQTPKRAKKGDIMKRVRYPFGPRKGNIWVHNDFKSIEPRILAEESGEKDIIRIFNEGQASAYVEGGWTYDPYEVLVDSVATTTQKDRSYLEALFEERGGARQVCKNNFLGWTYGEGVRKLASQMGCSFEEAFQIIEAMKATFGGVAPFMRYMQDLAKQQGFIRNRYGRKCVIPPPSRAYDEETRLWRWIEWWYKATNYLIQGTAADMLKEACIRLCGEDHYYSWNPDGGTLRLPQKAGYLNGSGVELILTIHDEIIVEMPFKFALRNESFVRNIGTVMADNQGMFKQVETPTDSKVTWDFWSDPEELETIWN